MVGKSINDRCKNNIEFQCERILMNLLAGLYRPANKSSRIRSASQMSHGLACCVPADTVILLALHHNTVTFGFVVLNGDGIVRIMLTVVALGPVTC